MPKITVIAGLVLSVLGVSSTFNVAFAQEKIKDPNSIPPAKNKSVEAYPSFVLQPLSARTAYREQYISNLLNSIRARGVDGTYIDQSVIDEMDENSLFEYRHNILKNTLYRDKNGDGIVTAEEIKKLLSKNNRKRRRESKEDAQARIDAEVDKLLAADENGDREINMSEALEFASEQARLNSRKKTSSLISLLTLDPNGDGKLTAHELEIIGLQVFKFFDADKNNIIEGDEQQHVRSVLSKDKKKKVRPSNSTKSFPCNAPKPGKNDEIILLSGYEGNAISTVSVAGMDRETTTGILNIEPGEKPLYIVATTLQAFVWQVKGATERVSKFVLFPPHTSGGVGAIGLKKSQVSILPAGSCFKFFTNSDSGGALQAKAVLETALGRPISKIVSSYTVGEFSVPSGAILPRNGRSITGFTVIKGGTTYYIDSDGVTDFTKRKKYSIRPNSMLVKSLPTQSLPINKNVDAGLLAAFKHYTPGGVVMIDKEKVIASREVIPYDVLPQAAGLIQLMRDGKIELLSDGAIYIKSPIQRFPARLQNPHVAKFILGKGVPVPKGNPRHVCVISEETGRPIRGASPSCG